MNILNTQRAQISSVNIGRLIQSGFVGFGVCALSACTTVPTKPITPTSAVLTSAPINTGPNHPLYKDTGNGPALSYGHDMPLVCENPTPAIGKSKRRPNLQIMWENFLHAKPEGVWKEIGGMVEVNGNLPLDQGRWTNACAVRLSFMFNRAKTFIPRIRHKTVSGANRDQYYYRVTDMEKFLTDYFGTPDVAITDGNQYDLPDTAGIVLMDFPNSSFTGHVTIWNGKATVDGSNIGGYKVLFWDLPCFTPADRQDQNIKS